MLLLDTAFSNFRNLEDVKLKFDSKFNLFYGENAQGKTNILESIYFNITGKSFRTKTIKDMIKYNNVKMLVYSNFKDKIGDKSIGISCNNKKDYYYNNKKVSYDEYIGKLNVISFIPEDISIITGPPVLRRSFFDYEISQSNFIYYQTLKEFDKLLKNRNKLLKDKLIKSDIFEIYNSKFVEIGTKLIYKRLEYVKKISILLNLNYRKLFDKESELKLNYKSFLGDIFKLNKDDIFNMFLKISKSNLKKESIYGYSLIGPQKDDYEFLLKNKNSKSFSSQGEKKSIIFALKISEIDMIVKDKREYPIFLIDDISSYFDVFRKESILEYFKKRNIQTFITSTEKLEIEGCKFYIEEGILK